MSSSIYPITDLDKGIKAKKVLFNSTLAILKNASSNTAGKKPIEQRDFSGLSYKLECLSNYNAYKLSRNFLEYCEVDSESKYSYYLYMAGKAFFDISKAHFNFDHNINTQFLTPIRKLITDDFAKLDACKSKLQPQAPLSKYVMDKYARNTKTVYVHRQSIISPTIPPKRGSVNEHPPAASTPTTISSTESPSSSSSSTISSIFPSALTSLLPIPRARRRSRIVTASEPSSIPSSVAANPTLSEPPAVVPRTRTASSRPLTHMVSPSDSELASLYASPENLLLVSGSSPRSPTIYSANSKNNTQIPTSAAAATSTSTSGAQSPPVLEKQQTALVSDLDNFNNMAKEIFFGSEDDNCKSLLVFLKEKMNYHIHAAQILRETIDNLESSKKAPHLAHNSLFKHCTEARVDIPEPIVACVQIIDANIKQEGLFRLSASTSTMRKLKYLFSYGYTPNSIKEYTNEPEAACSLLKYYLRHLSPSAFPEETKDLWTHVLSLEEPSKKLDMTIALLKTLPRHHKILIAFLFRFLAKVSDHKDYNKMEPKNLSLIFTPTLFKDSEIFDTMKLMGVVEYIISKYRFIFGDHSNLTKTVFNYPDLAKCIDTKRLGL